MSLSWSSLILHFLDSYDVWSPTDSMVCPWSRIRKGRSPRHGKPMMTFLIELWQTSFVQQQDSDSLPKIRRTGTTTTLIHIQHLQQYCLPTLCEATSQGEKDMKKERPTAAIQAASNRPTSSHLQHPGVLECAQQIWMWQVIPSPQSPIADVISILTNLEGPVGSSSRRMSAHMSMARTSPSLEYSIMYWSPHEAVRVTWI